MHLPLYRCILAEKTCALTPFNSAALNVEINPTPFGFVWFGFFLIWSLIKTPFFQSPLRLGVRSAPGPFLCCPGSLLAVFFLPAPSCIPGSSAELNRKGK